MIVRRPRAGARYGLAGLGAANPSWFADWTTSGHNDGGQILSFVTGQPNYDGAVALAAATGKSIPYLGDYEAGSGVPLLDVMNPPSTGSGFGTLYLDRASNYGKPPQFTGSWFVHPGDDVMAAAINRWITSVAPGTYPGSSSAFSQAIPLVGGQTASQAAAIDAINAQNAANAQTAAASASSATSSQSSGLPAASSGVSSFPWWVWALGAGALAWFAMKE